MKIKNGKARLLLACALLFSAQQQGWAVDNEASISFSGTLNEPLACTVNSGKSISVNFGNDLVTTKVDGSNYIRTIDYTLDCKGNSKNTMKMKIAGAPAPFDSTVLMSTKNNELGIALRANGAPLAVGSWLNFTYPNKPTLQAVPVKAAGTLSAGFFSAGATLLVEYQ